jgi:hypothetical protein
MEGEQYIMKSSASMHLGIIAAMAASIVLFCVGAAFPAQPRGDVPEVAVRSMEDYGLTIELTLPDFSIRERTPSVEAPSSEVSILSRQSDGCREILLPGWAGTGRGGHPELPLKGVLIQVPESGAIGLEIVESTVESLPGVDICPAPRLSVSVDEKPTAEYAADPRIYGSPDFIPDVPAEISPRNRFRNMAVARIMMHPFQWNPMTKELRYFKKLRLRVHFEDPLPFPIGFLTNVGEIEEGEVFTRLQQLSVLNYRGPTKVSQAHPVPRNAPGRGEVPAADDQRLRIEVMDTGIFRLSYKDLVKAKLNPRSIDPRTFQLFNRDQEVAVKVVSKRANRFKSGDYLEFYAEGLSTEFTDTNVYWLQWGGGAGKRMEKISGKVTGEGQELGSFSELLHLEENHVIWDGTPGAPTRDYWFWEKVTAPMTKEYSLVVPSPIADQSGAVVRVGYQGRSTASPHPNHHTRVSLNGTVIADSRWDGNSEYIQEAAVSPGLLIGGTNTLTLDAPGDAGAPVDIVYFNWVEIAYLRNFEAVADRLSFTLTGNGRFQVTVKKLGKRSIMIYEITDPRNVREVVSFSKTHDGPPYKATFETEIAGTKTYHVTTAGTVKAPEKTALWQPVNLKNPALEADLILITDREFLSAVEPLCALHRNQGLRVQAVSIQDIYNEFSSGLVNPGAVRDFLKTAYESWKPPAPTYVLLIGDANIDYRDHLGTGKENRVPVHLSLTESLGLTPDDNWYACVDGDDSLADMLIGRIPGSSPEAVSEEVGKIIDYEQNSSYKPRRALFVADNDQTEFETLDETLAAFLPSGSDIRKVYLRQYDNPDKATQDILSHIDQGMLVATYAGHGDVTGWAGERLFETADVATLSNADRLPFLITLDCLNGYFSQPYYYSLAEEFLITPDKGAIASFSPSGLGYTWEHEILGKEVYASLFKEGERRFGAITVLSKIKAYGKGMSEDLLKTFTLFGDPAGRIKSW